MWVAQYLSCCYRLQISWSIEYRFLQRYNSFQPMDPLLAAILIGLLLLVLATQCCIIQVLEQVIATARILLIRQPILREEAAIQEANVLAGVGGYLRHPLQETEPPLLQEGAVLQVVQEANGTVLGVPESLHQRNLPKALVIGKVNVGYCCHWDQNYIHAEWKQSLLTAQEIN